MADHDNQLDDGWVDIPSRDVEVPTVDEPSSVITGELPVRSGVARYETEAATTVISRPEPEFLYSWQRRLAMRKLRKHTSSPLFVANLEPSVNTLFMLQIPHELSQEYSCDMCHRFMSRVGSLALVAEDGTLDPLFWDDSDFDELPNPYHPAVTTIAHAFVGRTVTKQYNVTRAKQNAGAYEAGGFFHMSFDFPADRLKKDDIPGLASLNSEEAAEMLGKLLNDYKIGTIRRTATILEENKLPYADNHKAAVQWFRDLVENERVKGMDGSATRHNLIYRYSSAAFTGCLKQLRSGAASTLLEDVKHNRSWKSITLQWAKVCTPERYMRPSKAPKQGNIAAAENLFKALGLTGEDMRRKFVVHKDIPETVIMWPMAKIQRPNPKQNERGVFANVARRPTQASRSDLAGFYATSTPPTEMTFTSFVNKILPMARKIEYKLASRDLIYFFITGLAGSKPLMQWHGTASEGMNLASWYVHTWPRPVEDHLLAPHAWNEVSAIVPFPHLWDATEDGAKATSFPLGPAEAEGWKHYHSKNGFRYLLCLKGVKDGPGELCLFPTLLKTEFHAVRATIEAYSKDGLIEVPEEGARDGYVGGIAIDRSQTANVHSLRVTKLNGEVGEYVVRLFE